MAKIDFYVFAVNNLTSLWLIWFLIFSLYMFLRDGPHFHRHAGPWCAGIGCSVSVSNSQNNKHGEMSAAISSPLSSVCSPGETDTSHLSRGDPSRLPQTTQTSFLRSLCDLRPRLLLSGRTLNANQLWPLHLDPLNITALHLFHISTQGGDIEARVEFGCWISFL